MRPEPTRNRLNQPSKTCFRMTQVYKCYAEWRFRADKLQTLKRDCWLSAETRPLRPTSLMTLGDSKDQGPQGVVNTGSTMKRPRAKHVFGECNAWGSGAMFRCLLPAPHPDLHSILWQGDPAAPVGKRQEDLHGIWLRSKIVTSFRISQPHITPFSRLRLLEQKLTRGALPFPIIEALKIETERAVFWQRISRCWAKFNE